MARRGGLEADQRRERRREALLDAALELFATRGYLATPIEELCRTAHVSTKSFYGVYGSREECYLDLMRRTTERLIGAVVAAVAQESFDDIRASEDRILSVLAHRMGDDPRGAVVLFGRGSATTFAVEAERRRNRRRASEVLVDIWRQGLPDVDVPTGVATGTVGGLFDIVADWVASAEDLRDLDAQVLATRLAHFYRVVVAGLRQGKEILS